MKTERPLEEIAMEYAILVPQICPISFAPGTSKEDMHRAKILWAELMAAHPDTKKMWEVIKLVDHFRHILQLTGVSND
jgi:hypothetical protein